MKTLPEITIQRSQLIGKLVLDRDTTETLGHIHQLWLDTDTHQVDAIVCKSGFLKQNLQSFKWEQVEAIGEDSVLLVLSTEMPSDKFKGTEVVVGDELWTDAGNKAGTISDYCLNSQTGEVIFYLFVSNGWHGMTGGVYALEPEAVISVGTRRVIARDKQVRNAEQFAEGLSDKLAHAAKFLREDYAKTQQDIADVKKGSQSAVAQLQTTAGQIRSTLSGIVDQVEETTQQVTAQSKKKLSDVTEHLQEAAQKVATQVKEKAGDVQTDLEKNQASNLKETNHSVDDIEND